MAPHPPGIRQRHGRGCVSHLEGDGCPWQAEVYCKGEFKKVRKVLPTLEEAIAWREQTQRAVATGTVRAPLAPVERKRIQEQINRARSAKLAVSRDFLAEAYSLHRRVCQAVERASTETPSREARRILGGIWESLHETEDALGRALKAPGSRVPWYTPSGRVAA